MSPLKVGDTTVYKGKSGQWSFVAHRTSGILVFFFLLLHIVDVSLINFRGGDLYNEVHELYGNILLRIFECGLLFASALPLAQRLAHRDGRLLPRRGATRARAHDLGRRPHSPRWHPGIDRDPVALHRRALLMATIVDRPSSSASPESSLSAELRDLAVVLHADLGPRARRARARPLRADAHHQRRHRHERPVRRRSLVEPAVAHLRLGAAHARAVPRPERPAGDHRGLRPRTGQARAR